MLLGLSLREPWPLGTNCLLQKKSRLYIWLQHIFVIQAFWKQCIHSRFKQFLWMLWIKRGSHSWTSCSVWKENCGITWWQSVPWLFCGRKFFSPNTRLNQCIKLADHHINTGSLPWVLCSISTRNLYAKRFSTNKDICVFYRLLLNLYMDLHRPTCSCQTSIEFQCICRFLLTLILREMKLQRKLGRHYPGLFEDAVVLLKRKIQVKC